MSTLYVNTITPNSGDTVSVSGSLFVSGTINLGDANTDSISFGADVSSSILPDANNVYDLGSSTKSWRNVFGTASLATQSISASHATTASFLMANRAASSQTSITSIGTLTGLNVSGNVVITGSSLTLGAAQITASATTASFGIIRAAQRITASAFTGSFTGSLFGNAATSTTASFAISSSFIEASNVNGTVLSASYATQSTSASHALTAVTASHVAAAGVAGTVTSASQATKVTFTNTTSSFNALTATQVTASSATGSFIGLLTGQITASSATGSFTGSLSGDATTAVTASYAISASALQSNSTGDINITTINDIALSAGDDISLTSTTADGLITIHSAHTAGQSILSDANAAAGSIWDVDAGILDVDVQGAATVDASSITLTGAVTAVNGVQNSTVAVTATDSGAAIPAGTATVLVNADGDANHIVILPAPVVGNIIHIIENGTTGYELRTSSPASISINGGTGSSGESAIAGATTYIRCVCVSSTAWIATQFAADGTESKVEAAA
mgnify:CR=1 FL=1